MANVRLKQNIIIDGKLHARGAVVDDKQIPKHLRDSDHVDYDLENREGKVLLLRDLSFQSLPRSSPSGIPTSFPTHVAVGELIDLVQVPASKRESLVEGLDFKRDWSFEELTRLQKAQEEMNSFSREKPEPLFALFRHDHLGPEVVCSTDFF